MEELHKRPLRHPEAYVFPVVCNVLRAANREARTQEYHSLTGESAEREAYAVRLSGPWITLSRTIWAKPSLTHYPLLPALCRPLGLEGSPHDLTYDGPPQSSAS
jgi:hypothetical protein